MSETLAEVARRLARDYNSGPGLHHWKEHVMAAVTREAARGGYSVEVPMCPSDQGREWLESEGLQIGYTAHFNGEPPTILLEWKTDHPCGQRWCEVRQ